MAMDIQGLKDDNIITKIDQLNPLFDQIMDLEKKQEEAVKKATDLLTQAYGVTAEIMAYSNKNGSILITYQIKRPEKIDMEKK